MPAPASEAVQNGSWPCHDPGAHGATAPRPAVAPGAPVRGAKAKPADAGAGV